MVTTQCTLFTVQHAISGCMQWTPATADQTTSYTELCCMQLNLWCVLAGTTTATVLTRAILSEGCKSVAAGMNPMDLRRGINLAVDHVLQDLKSRAKMISTTEEIAQVCMLLCCMAADCFLFSNFPTTTQRRCCACTSLRANEQCSSSNKCFLSPSSHA